ncbi:ABC transporter permease [Cesiribacter andamanensis]|uniref:Macrolide export ATP-binding/permease protein MacB n=1 Tax=Cesiribacter andamanensis AMV16 TaxID=1279009 RepID=M7N3W3_9BACT|nr:FtsX-like permease family protein [Cesiribacter andamanensis]EMR01982.1 Macrolide export ATP-binding/permease protein MacB [Cesiribacter andamanensis AMV16]
MFTIIKIAWKNIWRNPGRSLVIIVSVVLGVWASLFIISFSSGMNEQRIRDLLQNYTGHVVIQHPDYTREATVTSVLSETQQARALLARHPQVRGWTARTLAAGMAQTSAGSYGVKILGIDTLQEQGVTNFHRLLQEGDFLQSFVRNPVVVGEKLATRLKLSLRSKLVLSFQNLEGEITAGVFRVSGIYRSNNSVYDEGHVYVRQADLQALLGDSQAVHELFILTEDYEQAQGLASSLNEQLQQDRARHWAEISPQLAYMNEAMQQFLLIFIGIIALGLTLGIINVMLMAILERSRELGMLMAIGMSRRRLFGMITAETLLLSSVGLPLGLLLTYLTLQYFRQRGIDLSVVSEGMASFGYETRVIPHLEGAYYWQVALIILFTTLLGSLYPSLKALKLKPVEAMRRL